MVEHRRQHIRQQPEFLDLAHRQSERDADRFFRPAERNEPLDRPPLIDRVQRLAGDVFDHAAHRAIVVGGVDHEHVDFLQPGRDRLPHTAMSGINDVAIAAIGLRRDHRRLDEPDRLDRRQEQRVGLG